MGFGLGSIGDAFSSAFDSVTESVGSAFDSAADHAVSSFDRAMDFADDIGDSIQQASFSDIGHTVLDVAGMVPVLGEAADLANAGWYAAEGDYTNAALSAASAIPFAGNAATAAKWADKANDVYRASDNIVDTTRYADNLRAPLQTGAGAADPSKLADEAYDAIRASRTDVDAIARNTGYKPENVQKVKDHVFNDEHLLDRYVEQGIPATRQRFDSNIDIADSWNRLENGTHNAGDISLMKHETAEAWHMRTHNSGYSASHDAAQRRFPSGLE